MTHHHHSLPDEPAEPNARVVGGADLAETVLSIKQGLIANLSVLYELIADHCADPDDATSLRRDLGDAEVLVIRVLNKIERNPAIRAAHDQTRGGDKG